VQTCDEPVPVQLPASQVATPAHIPQVVVLLASVPAEAQVLQVDPATHCPAELQDWVPISLVNPTELSVALQAPVLVLQHCVDPGTQTPVHAPLLQTKGQAVPFCHCPPALHVCGVVPVHWVAPGLQTPEHWPFAHTNGQAVPGTFWPAALHVCGTAPLQLVVLGMHAPLQAPPLQT
jgi:hypothetical protein